MRRIVEYVLFAVVVTVLVNWGLRLHEARQKRPEPLAIDSSPDLVVETVSPSEDEVHSEAERKAVEYATMWIIPTIPRPDLAKILPAEVHAEKTGTFGDVERWETSGALDHQSGAGEPIRSKWQITFGFHNRNFFPASMTIDGMSLPVPDSAAAKAIRAAENQSE
jgi:hypothetical protein